VTIRIDDKGSLFELEDGVPLTYNMRKAKEVYFKFKIKSKKSVNFNLIAPLNSFIMIVSNSAEKPDS
jgi:spore coat protein CotH